MKKACIYLGLAVLLITGCTSKDNRSTLKELRLNLPSDPTSLDPRKVRSLKDLTLVKQIYDGLMRLDASGKPEPALAKSVSLAEDQRTYTFILRETVWNNGDPVTAYDFVEAWREVLNASFGSDYAYMLYPIANARKAFSKSCPLDQVGIQATDAHTLVVTLERPTPYFLELTAFPTFFPVHSQDISITNGPFQLESWSLQNALRLVKNPTYWDEQSVHLDALCFTIVPDTNTQSYLFEKNEIDWLGQPISSNIATDLLGKMREQKCLASYPIDGTFWFVFNTQQAPFNDPQLRRAFSYAIDRQAIITHILQGNQHIATGPVPTSMALHDTPYFQDGNKEAARTLFEEALHNKGWDREHFPKITLKYTPSERTSKIVQLIQQQWKEAFDIPIELMAVESHLYARNLKLEDFQVGTGEWVADFHDPIAFLEIFKYRNEERASSGMNYSGWHSEIFQALLDQSLLESDPDKRRSLLHKAELLLVQEMPIACVYHYAFDYAKKDYVVDVILSTLGTADFKQARLL